MGFVSTKMKNNNSGLHNLKSLALMVERPFSFDLNIIKQHRNRYPNLLRQPRLLETTTSAPNSTMCTAKAMAASCGHTVAYEIMIPCKNYAGGPPCAAWDANLMNKVLLTAHPICVDCHIQKEKNLCRQYVDEERNLVRLVERKNETPKEIWEARLVKGVKMQADVYELDRKVGREGAWREKSRWLYSCRI